ncbi:enoyl-CoA hydratase family protein [Mycobacteroides abscessus]|uniref:enoyl-CoA hydratase family protein n=1 Tax=Mycobacteroides abscessus TaxID=36809 RepID=UPI0009A6511A|nr:enoyl-CoA hydratase family protein [Mycobacteroides abscessus]SKI94158.1 enoyl-CoA hydratase [Mycobacteroides abscessus subsp. massiliense]SKJ57172.1 enoyl-CoA hydratase [Mycobacteroides abscessus subsp. massiliense]SKK16220.1 enoyl-CoA hydratase [Mycobacteroides abscessus subsp. massiliense]SKR83605.1 enoyl-CoA hydratase [Mycobacteroides abscessus subsp. massiliense]SKT13948.1 enoyl-CoA hydratase [Mycobacteroides abscessus subsp. massiliense]
MSDTLVQYEVEGRAARLTLDSPHNRNALSSGLVRQLRERLQRAATDRTVRAVVLTHTGNTFCAGADLSESTGASADPQDVAKDRAGQLTALLRDILELPLPVVIAVNGHVRAGGFGLVGAADIAVAGPDSTFALTEARIGVAPSIISLTLLPRLTGRAAGRYFVTGEKFDARVAAEIGLVTKSVDSAEAVEAAVTSLVDDIALGSPQGLAESKRLTTAPILADFDARAVELTETSARLFVSPEAQEGMLAFLQKRPPAWQV